MESNIADQHLSSLESPAEPHFDEEATLLSARPVVPIETVDQKRGFTRAWLFGFALAGALLSGVAATALYYSRFPMIDAKQVTGNETVSSGAQGGQSESQDLKEPRPGAADAAGFGEPSVDSDTTPNAESSLVSSSARTSESATTNSKKSARRATVVDDQSSERKSERREERREARREAKEWKRAKRERRAGKASDDLLRIRDIFEGPVRP
jgi:hypothetical protein